MEKGAHYKTLYGSATSSSRRTYLLVAAGIVVVLVVAVLIVAISLGVALNQGCGSTLECLSESVRDSMDSSANPCEDFYKYSCGGWNSRNPIPVGAASTSRFRKVNSRNIESLRNAIESGRDGDVRAVQLAKQLYDSCGNTGLLNELGAQPLVELVRATGGWDLINIFNSTAPAWSINSEDFLTSQAQGNDAFFTLSVGIDYKNSSRYMTQVIQSGLTLPVNFYPQSQISLTQYINEILSMLGPSSYFDEAADIAAIETALAQIFVSNEVRDPNLKYNPIPLGQMQQTYWNQFNWSSYVKARFARAGVAVTDDLMVNVVTPSYFSQLSQTLSSFTTSQLENYFKWRLVARYFGFLGTDHLQVIQKFHQNIEGLAIDSSRAATCVGILQSVVPYTLARLYTKYILPSGTREEMSTTASDIMTAFKDNLENNTWLDQQTIDASVDKVNAVIKDVAYPEFIFNDTELLELSKPIVASGGAYFNTINFFFNGSLLDLLGKLNKPVDRIQWNGNPTQVNAFYSPNLNKIVFLEGILNNPFIMAGWPGYFQYGAIGVVAGHELSHGFDDQGHQFNKNGNLQQWWTDASLDAFNERAQCFVNQYSKYTLMGLQINGNLTLGENIADNGGLTTAYRAYTNSLSQSVPQEKLPSIDLTSQQLFFVAFSQLWCSAYTSDRLKTLINTDPHSPGPIRVLGTLSNSVEFATAFNCPVNSPMNPSNKCKLW